jgi:integrase
VATKERKRRDNGDGTIYGPDKNGYFHARVVVGKKPNGEPDRRHVMSKSRSKVVEGRKELIRKRDAGKVTKPGKASTVAEIMQECLTVTWPALVSENLRRLREQGPELDHAPPRRPPRRPAATGAH